ncbi:MAG: hypothetical protein N3A66_04530, partial [Planctomycetota bacterium]|nr:hypothetical protein [Planctomycetota bacterium]
PEGQPLFYSLVGGRTDLFALSSNRLLVKAGAFFDAQAAAQHTVVIRATDTLGAFREETFVIHIADVQESTPIVAPPAPAPLPPPPAPPMPPPASAPGFTPPAYAAGAGESLFAVGSDDLGLENAASFAWQEERRIPLTPAPADALWPTFASGDLVSRLADLAFSDDLLDDPAQPTEIREAFTAILQAYVTSSEELSAYLQSAFRSVAEAAVLHKTAGDLLQHAEQALPHFREQPEANLAAYRDLLEQTRSAQNAALRATAELRSAVLAAVSAGEAGFDRSLEDVVTAALAAINYSNDRLLLLVKTIEETLRRWREGAEGDAPRLSFAEIIPAARESASQAVEAERRRWDLASEDVFAAFLKRVVSDPKRLPRGR